MTTLSKRPKTVLPGDVSEAQLSAFLRQMERLANKQMTLTSADGEEVLLPDVLFDVLRRVAEALASGRGVTVIPQETQLTTQQAADMLGISRPSLIKLLEDGKLPFDTIGRHRRITFRDLDQYRSEERARRKTALRQMAREGQQSGLHDLTPTDRPTRK